MSSSPRRLARAFARTVTPLLGVLVALSVAAPAVPAVAEGPIAGVTTAGPAASAERRARVYTPNTRV